jgi:hypothetical protein
MLRPGRAARRRKVAVHLREHGRSIKKIVPEKQNKEQIFGNDYDESGATSAVEMRIVAKLAKLHVVNEVEEEPSHQILEEEAEAREATRMVCTGHFGNLNPKLWPS